MVAIAACYVYRKQVRCGDRRTPSSQVQEDLGGFLRAHSGDDSSHSSHTSAGPILQGQGIKRSVSATQASWQGSHLELGQATRRAGENDSKPGAGPEGGILR